MPGPPQTDAVKCLEQLWQFMELDLPNRVASKIGRTSTLELNKLANLGSNAALVHPTVPRSALSPARLRRSGSQGAVLSADQRAVLRDLFIKYASWGAKHSYTSMSCSQFLRFCKDARCVTREVDSVTLTLLFEKVQLESPEPASGTHIILADWVELLQLLALTLYPQHTPQDGWQALLQDHVMALAANSPRTSHSGSDDIAAVIAQPNVAKVLAAVKHKLRPIFDAYAASSAVLVPQHRVRRPVQSVATLLASLTAAPTAQAMDSDGLVLSPAPEAMLSPSLRELRTSSATGMSAMAAGMSQAGDGAAFLTNRSQAVSQPGAPTVSPPISPTAMLSPGGPQPGAAQQASKAQAASRAQLALPAFYAFLHDFGVLPALVSKAQAAAAFRAARFGLKHARDVRATDGDDDADMARIDFTEFVDAVARCALLAFNFELEKPPEAVLVLNANYHPQAKALWGAVARQALQERLQGPDVVCMEPAKRGEEMIEARVARERALAQLQVLAVLERRERQLDATALRASQRRQLQEAAGQAVQHLAPSTTMQLLGMSQASLRAI